MNNISSKTALTTNYKGILLDLIIYLSVMFLVREIYFPKIGFIANGLFWSVTTLLVATWRMKVRGVTWRDLGLVKPNNLWKTLGISVIIFVTIIISMIIFELLKDQFPSSISPDNSSENAISKFGNLKGDWLAFFSIIPMILLESLLEELLDRGFLMNWFEKLFSTTSFATVIAVLLQAVIFGFRHSNDFSERSITVGIIGLIMGIAYVKFRRNLWPLIIAHCILNSMSMIERVL